MLGKWDSYLKPRFDENHIGEMVDCMEVEEQVESPKGMSLKLHCVGCDEHFWAEMWEGGKNTRIRIVNKEKELHVKCPKSGCEWDGKFRHFYAIQQPLTKHQPHTFLADVSVDMAIIETFEGSDPLEILTAYYDGLSEKEKNGLKGVGLSLLTIPGDIHRSFQKRKEVIGKIKTGEGGFEDFMAMMMGGLIKSGPKSTPKANGNGKHPAFKVGEREGVSSPVADPVTAN